MGKEHLKKDGEELQNYLLFRRRGCVVDAKKGKGTVYKRAKEKQADYKARKQENE